MDHPNKWPNKQNAVLKHFCESERDKQTSKRPFTYMNRIIRPFMIALHFRTT